MIPHGAQNIAILRYGNVDAPHTGCMNSQNSPQLLFADLVAIAKRPEPDPIPNSTVKCFSANGTLS